MQSKEIVPVLSWLSRHSGSVVHAQVLHSWPVPSTIGRAAARAADASSAVQPAQVASPGEADEQGAAGPRREGDAAQDSLAAAAGEGEPWGRQHAAELAEVVRWAAPRLAWEHLRRQLQVRVLAWSWPTGKHA